MATLKTLVFQMFWIRLYKVSTTVANQQSPGTSQFLDSRVHLSLSQASSSVTPTLCKSSFTTAMNLLCPNHLRFASLALPPPAGPLVTLLVPQSWNHTSEQVSLPCRCSRSVTGSGLVLKLAELQVSFHSKLEARLHILCRNITQSDVSVRCCEVSPGCVVYLKLS